MSSTAGNRGGDGGSGGNGGGKGGGGVNDGGNGGGCGCRSAAATSPMSANRFFASFASAFLTIDTIHAGTSGRTDARSFGSPKCNARSNSAFVSPSNGRARVSIR